MNALEKRTLATQVEASGFHLGGITNWPAKATYYKPSGEPMPRLPADPESMKRYLARGFTLAPPAPGTEVATKVIADTAQPSRPAAVAAPGIAPCGECGFQPKSTFGARAHSRKHRKE